MKETTKSVKLGTRGEQMIRKENKETLSLYFNLIAVVMSITIGFNMLIFRESIGNNFYVMNSISALIYIGSYKMLSYMDSTGSDISDTEVLGICEYFKDVIILTLVTQSLSLFSNYFWFLMLLAPIYAGYKFWTDLAAPWFFAPAPEEDETDLKKSKRKDRIKYKRA